MAPAEEASEMDLADMRGRSGLPGVVGEPERSESTLELKKLDRFVHDGFGECDASSEGRRLVR